MTPPFSECSTRICATVNRVVSICWRCAESLTASEATQDELRRRCRSEFDGDFATEKIEQIILQTEFQTFLEQGNETKALEWKSSELAASSKEYAGGKTSVAARGDLGETKSRLQKLVGSPPRKRRHGGESSKPNSV